MVPFSFMGFVLIPGVGEVIGFVFSLFIFLSIILWGDKIILTFANAFLLKGKASLRQIISNQTCLLGMDNIELYITHKHPNNIYFLSSYFDHSIIIGRSLFDKLDKKEVKNLVTFGVHKINTKGTRNATICTLCFSLFFLPIFILQSLLDVKFLKLGVLFKFFSDIIMFFYMPALAINQYVMSIINENEKFDREFCIKTYSGHLLSSTLFKLETMRQEHRFTGSAFILNQLAVSPDVNLEMIREMNYVSNNFATRYKNVYFKGLRNK
jgi:hypothetical protein